MKTKSSNRVACSLKALGIGWLASGTVFSLVVEGPSTIAFWCIWGTAFFALGWAFVGLPLIVIGDRVRTVSLPLVVLAGGLGGALVMALPVIVFGLTDPAAAYWRFSISDLKWEGIAFLIAAATTGLYRLFLNRLYRAYGSLPSKAETN